MCLSISYLSVCFISPLSSSLSIFFSLNAFRCLVNPPFRYFPTFPSVSSLEPEERLTRDEQKERERIMGKRDEINKRRGRRGEGRRKQERERFVPRGKCRRRLADTGKGVKMTSANFFPHESRCCSNPGVHKLYPFSNITRPVRESCNFAPRRTCRKKRNDRGREFLRGKHTFSNIFL